MISVGNSRNLEELKSDDIEAQHFHTYPYKGGIKEGVIYHKQRGEVHYVYAKGRLDIFHTKNLTKALQKEGFLDRGWRDEFIQDTSFLIYLGLRRLAGKIPHITGEELFLYLDSESGESDTSLVATVEEILENARVKEYRFTLCNNDKLRGIISMDPEIIKRIKSAALEGRFRFSSPDEYVPIFQELFPLAQH